MRQVHDPALLRSYIDRYNLQDRFSLDLSSAATLFCYEEDELISQMGDQFDHILILVEGECMAYVLTGTDKIHCESHYRGLNIMGMTSVLWEEPNINSLRTITPCTCLAIPASLYRDALLNDVRFLRAAVRSLASHVRKSAAHFEPLETRLAAFILEMEQEGLFRYNLTLCADLLETSYRHLLRTLRTFCDMGLLQKRGKACYEIIDRTQLELLQTGDSISGVQPPRPL
ncbi:putative Regulatory protein YeiL [uncultured Eubacteriales bacterium]|uniref:Putative Regulatory protein YeiL n=1 Tax=uncultured Eubacteriales bacterium TaxID=172733 RepID=A0A212KGV4_9FIRM|nr:putative Regulatory protein YeiL [uncultured Eubacteriales bacterium]